jgi:hypothetical protein
MVAKQAVTPTKIRPAGGAVFDSSRLYRYALWRRWNVFGPRLAFVMLNPSTADAVRDDPTIRRCLAFARSWGFGSLEIVNLFAYRAVQPAELEKASDPVGPENDAYLLEAARRARLLVAGWGNHGALHGRDKAVMRLLDNDLYCLGTTQLGQPRHPLYVSASAAPEPWPPTCAS